MSIIAFLIIGLLAGWIAGKIMKGEGFGMIGNLVVGIIGALVGGFVFSFVGLHTFSFIGRLVTSVVGAIIFLYVLQLIKR
ncbi:MAG TPA: GlsB/YeaQ/YmgE family stress response membrane protein [Balneolales bacterium]|nr:GlsB/YeaQ/YmgE family stress response membrane protein [Balneolales bacterium]